MAIYETQMSVVLGEIRDQLKRIADHMEKTL